MTHRRFIAAVLAGTVVLLPVGFLLYGVLFAWLFEEGALRLPGVMRESPQLGWILAAQLPFGVLLALVVSWRGAASFWAGARTGAILGFLMAAAYDLSQHGTTHLWTLTATLIDPFVSAMLVSVAGGVVGAILSVAPADSRRASGNEVGS